MTMSQVSTDNYGMPELKASLREKCLPRVIYGATLKHENYHVQQCKKFHKEYVSNSPIIFG